MVGSEPVGSGRNRSCVWLHGLPAAERLERAGKSVDEHRPKAHVHDASTEEHRGARVDKLAVRQAPRTTGLRPGSRVQVYKKV